MREIERRQIRLSPVVSVSRRGLVLDDRDRGVERQVARSAVVRPVTPSLPAAGRMPEPPPLRIQPLRLRHPPVIAASHALHVSLAAERKDDWGKPVRRDMDATGPATRTCQHTRRRVPPEKGEVKGNSGASKKKALSGMHPESASILNGPSLSERSARRTRVTRRGDSTSRQRHRRADADDLIGLVDDLHHVVAGSEAGTLEGAVRGDGCVSPRARRVRVSSSVHRWRTSSYISCIRPALRSQYSTRDVSILISESSGSFAPPANHWL